MFTNKLHSLNFQLQAFGNNLRGHYTVLPIRPSQSIAKLSEFCPQGRRTSEVHVQTYMSGISRHSEIAEKKI